MTAPRSAPLTVAVDAAWHELTGRLGPAGTVARQAPLGPLTTYRVGGPAALLVTARDPDHLTAVAAAASTSGLPVLVVGRGSNLLVADAGFAGIAVVLDGSEDAFGRITVAGLSVTAGAAVPLPALARRSTDAGLTGLEWAVGVPGSVGGGVRMNAGGHGSDMAHSLVRARIADLHAGATPLDWSLDDLRYRYRHSAVEAHHVVLEAEFRLRAGDASTGRETIREIVRWRRDHQPGGQNAGSVFTNPPGTSAGWLVESAGLKGRRWGSAAVSSKHANFIQADPAGSADDVLALIRLVQARVFDAHGVSLHTEVRLIGFPSQVSTSDGGFE